MLKLDTKIHRVEVVHTGPELVLVYVQLRADCEAAGHALAQRQHNADRWIAGTALLQPDLDLVGRPHSKMETVTWR